MMERIFRNKNVMNYRFFKIPREFEKTTATVRNATGKVVHQEVLTSGMVTLNLRGLASGSYVLHLHTKDGSLDETHQIQIAK